MGPDCPAVLREHLGSPYGSVRRVTRSSSETGLLEQNDPWAVRYPLAFANQIAAAVWSHVGRVNGARGYVAAVSNAVGLRLSGYGEGEFAGQNDVCGLIGMGVVRIVGVWTVLPDIGVAEAFLAEFFG